MKFLSSDGMPLYFEIASDSMNPVLRKGDKVTAVKKDVSDLKVGEVVVFRQNSKYILHRIVKIDNFVVVTAGDNLRKYDPPISLFDIVGVVENIPVEKPKSEVRRFFRSLKRKLFKIFIGNNSTVLFL